MHIGEKRKILALLHNGDVENVLVELGHLSSMKVVNALFTGICSNNEIVRWNAVTAMGQTVALLAAHDIEQARIIMRRCMWSLNDESGGIGWGAPEAMAEIMAVHPGLAAEYAHMLVSYMREDGNFLEYEIMQRGVLWGAARLAQAHPELLMKWNAPRYLEPYLASCDPAGRGLTCLGLGILKQQAALEKIHKLVDDPGQVRLYWNRKLKTMTVAALAQQAITTLSG